MRTPSLCPNLIAALAAVAAGAALAASCAEGEPLETTAWGGGSGGQDVSVGPEASAGEGTQPDGAVEPDIAEAAPEALWCPADPDETPGHSNDDCSVATDMGTIADVGSSPLVLKGELSTESDVDWFAFVASDTLETPAHNSYRVHVAFAPDGNVGDEFRFDVARAPSGPPCAAAAKSSLTTYDWCADSTPAPAKPSDAESTAPYRVRVYRNAAVPARTCNQYKIEVRNGGTGQCPAADACGNQ